MCVHIKGERDNCLRSFKRYGDRASLKIYTSANYSALTSTETADVISVSWRNIDETSRLTVKLKSQGGHMTQILERHV